MIVNGRVHCDTCNTEQPSADAVMAAHGLIRLGWYCKGGSHVCPACPHPRTPEEIAADRAANGGTPLRNEGSVR